MSQSQIQVIDILSNEILYECSLEESDKAYAFATSRLSYFIGIAQVIWQILVYIK